ncbi:hypothetical protein AB0G04_06340 [Actinoplanes sp. NPDC023801]|uniref:hypothetical protein n=1 Tax=Actinoplanes sp. NPDC023801 TaxID=3154595 RepID=UPI0033E2BE0A
MSPSRGGRIFVNLPKWGDEVPANVTELRDGQPVQFPDQRWNTPDGNADERTFVSVQSVVVDLADRLWVLDTAATTCAGSPGACRRFHIGCRWDRPIKPR